MRRFRWFMWFWVVSLAPSLATAQTFLSEGPSSPVDIVVWEDLDGPEWSPGSIDEAESARYVVKTHIINHATEHGLANSNDYLDLVVGNAFYENLDGDENPPGFASQSITNYAIDQHVGGVALDEGRIAAGFFADRLNILVGRVWSRAYVEAQLAASLAQNMKTYDEARASLSGTCTTTDHLGPKVARASLKYGRRYYRFLCDEDNIYLDAATLAVLERFLTEPTGRSTQPAFR